MAQGACVEAPLTTSQRQAWPDKSLTEWQNLAPVSLPL